MKGFGKQYKSKEKINKKTKLYKEQIINQAIQFHLQGNIQEAARSYKYCISQGFKDHRVYANYGIILKDAGKLKEAELNTRQAIELNPNLAEAHSNLGCILKDLGNLKDSELSIRKAIEIKPNYADAFFNLGIILLELSRLKEAELSTRKAIELNPNLPEAHSNLGIILLELEKLKEAELSTRKAIEIKPNYADAYFNLFRQYDKMNNLTILKESLNEFTNINSIKNELLLFRSRLSYRNKDYQTAKYLIDNISPKWIGKINSNQKLIFWSYKGFIEDKIGNYDIAYHCFENSQNDVNYKRFRKESYLNYLDSYKKSIINKKINIKHFNDGIKDSNLAFLIGFPRSGTTLLDTILRSHPEIEVIEEKPIIQNIEKLVKEKFDTELNDIYSLSEENIITLRKKYIKLLNTYKNKKVNLLIDKLPLHTVSLPLINLLFPNAKIIFTHRHPYDTVLSCFQQYFKPNIAMANLVSLKSSSSMYDQVMNAWDMYKNNLTFDFITSKYEHLIEDFDSHTLKILEFLGVGWNAKVKNYRKTALDRSKINTPSSSQVVEPLYRSSIEKWKNYEKYFDDCHKYLEKWISYFDY